MPFIHFKVISYLPVTNRVDGVFGIFTLVYVINTLN